MNETTKELNAIDQSLPKAIGPGIADTRCKVCGRMTMSQTNDFCFWHDPKTTQAEKAMVRLKAQASLTKRNLKLSKVITSAKTPEDLHGILNVFIQDLAAGRIDTADPGECLLRAIGRQQDAISATLTNKRLKALEDKQ